MESVFGRMFGFGNLEVLTASESGIEQLRMLRDAKDFKKAMIEAKHELELELTRPTMPPVRARARARPGAGAGARARRAGCPRAHARGGHRRRGRRRARRAWATCGTRAIISPEEFEAKKAELLGRL